MISSRFRISGLWLFILTAVSLLAQRPGRGGGTLPTQTATELIVHGSVVLPDGIVPGRLVQVEQLCGGRMEAVTYADSKGRFSFNLGVVDRPGSYGQSTAPTGGRVINAASMKNCSIRASLLGYHPQTVPLDQAVKNQKATLGKMLLQPLGRQQSALMSATDGDVPKNARQDYEKGLDEVAKSKWQEAISAMQKATSAYSRFATAWLSLGMLQSLQNNTDAALQSYARAMAADDKFAPPYLESAVLEAASDQWAKVIEHTNKAIILEPDSFAGGYYLNAMANIRLDHSDAARKSVAEGLRVDEDHEYPDLEYTDGILLMNQGNREGARKRFESYLGIAPNGRNAGNARQLLTELPAQK